MKFDNHIFNLNTNFIVRAIKDQEDLETIVENEGITKDHLSVKIQVFASKFGLNNCKQDMSELSKKGCIFVSLTEHNDYTYKLDKNGKLITDVAGHYIREDYTKQMFSVQLIKKEDKQEYRRKDFSFHTKTAHLFFEIPVVANFTEKQHKKWLNYCIRELSKLIEVNHKRRDSWLKKKKLEQDFMEDDAGTTKEISTR